MQGHHGLRARHFPLRAWLGPRFWVVPALGVSETKGYLVLTSFRGPYNKDPGTILGSPIFGIHRLGVLSLRIKVSCFGESGSGLSV